MVAIMLDSVVLCFQKKDTRSHVGTSSHPTYKHLEFPVPAGLEIVHMCESVHIYIYRDIYIHMHTSLALYVSFVLQPCLRHPHAKYSCYWHAICSSCLQGVLVRPSIQALAPQQGVAIKRLLFLVRLPHAGARTGSCASGAWLVQGGRLKLCNSLPLALL